MHDVLNTIYWILCRITKISSFSSTEGSKTEYTLMDFSSLMTDMGFRFVAFYDILKRIYPLS